MILKSNKNQQNFSILISLIKYKQETIVLVEQMNRSKSSNLFSTPSYIEYNDYDDHYIEQNPQQLTDRFFKKQCVDLKWIRSLQEKQVHRKKGKLHRGYSDLHKINREFTLGHQFTGFGNLKQEWDDYILQNQQKYLGKVRKYKNKEKQRGPFQNIYVSEYPQYIVQSPKSKQQIRSLDHFKNKRTYSTATNCQQQSTRQEQLKEQTQERKQLQFLKRKAIKLEKGINILKQQKKLSNAKMLQYEIQIDKLRYEIQNLRLNQSQQYSLQASVSSFQNQIDSLQQALCEQTQLKQGLIKQRDSLLTQLSDALKSHDEETNMLKQKTSKLEQQKKRLQVNQNQSKSQLYKVKEQLQNKQRKLAELSQKYNSQQQQIKQKKGMLTYLEEQVQRLAKQNISLTNQTDILVDSLQSIREELENTKHWNNQFELIIKDRQKIIQHQKQQIQRLMLKTQQCIQQCQFLRRLVSCNENNAKQHENNINSRNQQIKDLSKQVSTLKQQNQSFKKMLKAKTKLVSSSIAHIPIIQQPKMLEAICSTLKLPLDADQQQILNQIQKIISQNDFNGQIANDYYDILQMFNVPLNDECGHQKLLTQICQFRNHATILIKKVSNLEKKLWSVVDQNNRLVYKIKHGQIQEVRQLQRLVQEQNQQILKYRLHMCALAFKRQKI